MNHDGLHANAKLEKRRRAAAAKRMRPEGHVAAAEDLQAAGKAQPELRAAEAAQRCALCTREAL
eukprot:3095372-Lingulodinium_polyedra.AAC.1